MAVGNENDVWWWDGDTDDTEDNRSEYIGDTNDELAQFSR
jgi:hypothetical protein